ncbi:MAG: inositol monophosphatase family protein, partial [Paracoccaceae bacterium]
MMRGLGCRTGCHRFWSESNPTDLTRLSDVDLLVHAARHAGKIATAFVGGDLGVEHKPDGAGPVTAADLAVNDALEAMLRAARPGYGWLSEESADDAARLSHDRVFILDPIDGTRSFIEGSRTWAHALAVVEAGQVIAGVVYLPLRDLMYTAARGQGAQCNGAALHVSRTSQITGADVLATRPNMDPAFWRDGVVPAIKRSHRPS